MGLVRVLLRQGGLTEARGQFSVPTLGIQGNEAVMQLVTKLAAGLDHSPCITHFKFLMKDEFGWEDGSTPWRKTTEPGMKRLIFGRLDFFPPRPQVTVAPGAEPLQEACIFPSLEAKHLKAAGWTKETPKERNASKTYYRVTLPPGNKRVAVHRALCVLWEGPPPRPQAPDEAPKNHASHECDNRGCCNPRHMKWRTFHDNVQLSREYKKQRAGHGAPSPIPPPAQQALVDRARQYYKKPRPPKKEETNKYNTRSNANKRKRK
jgi:hypothetical protein